MSASGPTDEIDRFYRSYGRAFAVGDLAALEKLCECPMLISDAKGDRVITDVCFFASLFEAFRRSSWSTTRLDSSSKCAMGRDGAVLTIEFTRLRTDGTELGPRELPFHNGCSYFLKLREDGWKLVGLTGPLRAAAA